MDDQGLVLGTLEIAQMGFGFDVFLVVFVVSSADTAVFVSASGFGHKLN